MVSEDLLLRGVNLVGSVRSVSPLKWPNFNASIDMALGEETFREIFSGELD